MEVLRGNQEGSKHSRRHSDRTSLPENRLLDWARHDSDIDLLPHSPLALSDVLSHQGGYLDLVPISVDEQKQLPDTQQSDLSAQVTARSGKPPARTARLRFNLLTSHSEQELLRRCKKILVENALIKCKGDRQLFLAAGFISWPDPQNLEERRRAPLMLYPALLVRITNQQKYEIRLAGDAPEFNTILTTHIEQRYDLQLPVYEEDTPLADYFAQVAEALHGVASLALEFDVALGSSSMTDIYAQGETVILPAAPASFNRTLAMGITGNKSLKQLTAMLQLIPEFNSEDSISLPIDKDKDSAATSKSQGSIARLRRYAVNLAAEGLDHIEFQQLAGLPDSIRKQAATMSEACISRTIADVLGLSEISARELLKLAGIIELIDKAPDNIDQWGHSDLCFANSTILLRRAQHQARLIEDEMNALQEHFHLEKIPAKSQLLSLMSELGGNNADEPELVDADYFNARRQFMEFSTDKPANLTADHRRSLSQLAKVLRFRELFVNNVEYRAALGSGYKGLRTDWDLLIQHSEYARELSQVLDSEAIAAAIIENWQAFRESIGKELDTLQKAADAARRLLGVVGIGWQTRSVSGLAKHAELVADRLSGWQEQYGSIHSHAEKTASFVLSSFSESAMDHVLVETQVDEALGWIRQQLSQGDISMEQVSATLHWLEQACAIANQYDLDTSTIIEHLQVA